MTVFLNANSVSELKFHPPGGSRAAAIAVPVKKENIEEFFPRAHAHVPGYIMRDDLFKSRITEIVETVLKEMGETRAQTNEREFEELQVDPSAGISPNLRSKQKFYPKKLNEFQHTEHIRQNQIEKKRRILDHLQRVDWNYFKKMAKADQLYEEAKQYERAAYLEVLSLGASEALSEALSLKNISRMNLSKFGFPHINYSKFGLGRINTGKLQGNIGPILYDINPISSFAAGFATVGAGKVLDSMLGTEGATEEQGNKSPKFQALDCMKGPDKADTPLKMLGSAASFLGKAGRLVFRQLNIGAAAVNTFGNLLLASEYYDTSWRVSLIEAEMNNKNSEFFSQLAIDICDDFEALNDAEIDDFIEYFRKK